MASSSQQDRLTALPAELALMVFGDNVPGLDATAEDVEAYFRSHSLNKHVRDIAKDAFSRHYVHKVHLAIDCVENGRLHYHKPMYLDNTLVSHPLGRHITKALVRVQCLDRWFLREMVAETMQVVRKLVKQTGLNSIAIELETREDDELFLDLAHQILGEDLVREFPQLRFMDLPANNSHPALSGETTLENMGTAQLRNRLWRRLPAIQFPLSPQDDAEAKETFDDGRDWRWSEVERMWELWE